MRDSYWDSPRKGSSDEEILNGLEACKEYALRRRAPYLDIAKKALLYWAGDQWASVESTIYNVTHRRTEVPAYCDVRIVDNQFPIYARQMASNASQALPGFEAISATSDKDDRLAAEIATMFLSCREHEDDETDLREQELLWLLGAGECLRRTWYDAKKTSADGVTGDISTEIVPLFRYAKCPDDGDQWPPRWLIEYDARHVDWIEAEYGVRVEPEHLALEMAALDDLAMNVVTSRSRSRSERSSMAIVWRLYAQPTEKHPNGWCYVWSGKHLLKQHEFQGGIFPFTRTYWYPIPGRLYAMPYLEPLLSDQRQLNTLLSQLQEIQDRQLRMDIIHDGMGKVVQSVIQEETGQKEIILPPETKRWEFMTYDANIQLANQSYERLMRNLHDKAGMAEPTLGQVTARDSTATELQLLREAGLQSVSWHMNKFEAAAAKALQVKLALARDYFQVARMLTTLGGDAQEGLRYFFGAQLRSTRDVRPLPISKLSPAMRRAMEADAAAKGMTCGWATDEEEARARMSLRLMGLVEMEREIARRYGTLEELHERLIMKRAARRHLEDAQIMMALQQAQGVMNGQLPPPAAAAAPQGQSQGRQGAERAVPAPAPVREHEQAGQREIGPYGPRV